MGSYVTTLNIDYVDVDDLCIIRVAVFVMRLFRLERHNSMESMALRSPVVINMVVSSRVSAATSRPSVPMGAFIASKFTYL